MPNDKDDLDDIDLTQLSVEEINALYSDIIEFSGVNNLISAYYAGPTQSRYEYCNGSYYKVW